MIKECTNEEFRVVLLAGVYWTSTKERESLRRDNTSMERGRARRAAEMKGSSGRLIDMDFDTLRKFRAENDKTQRYATRDV